MTNMDEASKGELPTYTGGTPTKRPTNAFLEKMIGKRFPIGETDSLELVSYLGDEQEVVRLLRLSSLVEGPDANDMRQSIHALRDVVRKGGVSTALASCFLYFSRNYQVGEEQKTEMVLIAASDLFGIIERRAKAAQQGAKSSQADLDYYDALAQIGAGWMPNVFEAVQDYSVDARLIPGPVVDFLRDFVGAFHMAMSRALPPGEVADLWKHLDLPPAPNQD